MEQVPASFLKYIFVCENERPDAACCGAKGTQIREALKKKIKEMGLDGKVRVSRAGCVDVCSQGPNVLLMPESVWFKKVQISDVDEIVAKAIEVLNA